MTHVRVASPQSVSTSTDVDEQGGWWAAVPEEKGSRALSLLSPQSRELFLIRCIGRSIWQKQKTTFELEVQGIPLQANVLKGKLKGVFTTS